jgi:hypothetical protein
MPASSGKRTTISSTATDDAATLWRRDVLQAERREEIKIAAEQIEAVEEALEIFFAN